LNHPNNGRAGKHIINNNNWLVVLANLKNMKVNGKDDIPYIMEKKHSKPPTKYIYIIFYFDINQQYSSLWRVHLPCNMGEISHLAGSERPQALVIT
jgi:hypothetical protein